MNYWQECIGCAFDEAGLSASEEQIKSIAKNVEFAHNMYGEAHGYEHIPNPIQLENDKLKKKLKFEEEKITCPECKGKRSLTTHGPYHSATSSCFLCKGDGKIHPSKIPTKYHIN